MPIKSGCINEVVHEFYYFEFGLIVYLSSNSSRKLCLVADLCVERWSK